MQLVKYDAACRAVAEAKSIDEVREIKNRAEAFRAYARQAKDRQMELDAIEIRVRAEIRGGELIKEMRSSNVLGRQGQFNGEKGKENRKRLLTLADLGIDGDDSAIMQRLASLPPERREVEIKEWRKRMESAPRIEVPLQIYRRPTIKGDRQKAAARHGRLKIDESDRFSKFIAPDGRRVADWRAGELARIETVFRRAADCARSLQDGLPVANADPLATMEMIFKSDELLRLLKKVWDDAEIAEARGLQSPTHEASRLRRMRVCQNCQKSFVMDARGNSAGKFCSRECSFENRRRKARIK